MMNRSYLAPVLWQGVPAAECSYCACLIVPHVEDCVESRNLQKVVNVALENLEMSEREPFILLS